MRAETRIYDFMTQDPMRYALQLEMLEKVGALGDEEAIALLRSEFVLAQNAGRFNALTASEIEIGHVSRSTPQEGVTRYLVELEIEERHPNLDDDAAASLLCRAFTNALNASYFQRICEDALTMKLISREPAEAPAPLRYAA
jgi:hypothetical protein